MCKPFKIGENDILGRYLVATRPIKAGEIILKEQPLIWGPSQITAPVCLGCGKILQQNFCIACRKCGWPMCSEKCQESKAHFPECVYTQQKGSRIVVSNFVFPHPNYQCLTILRILFQKENDAKLWEKLMKLESHCKERKETEKYENDRVSVAQFIRKFFKLEEKFTEEEILRICGILQVNGHEIPLTEPPYVAIYEQTSMFEHNCKANCCKSFTSDGEILITAGVPIEFGEHLNICYTDSLWGTSNRRHYLAETKFFNCMCARCSDPTEFGTYFSAVKCQNIDCKGYVLPDSFLVDPKKDYDQTWKCNICDKKLTSNAIQNIMDRIGRDLNAMQKGDWKSCQIFLDYYQKLLHHNHYYLTDVRLALGQLIGQHTEDGLNSIPEDAVDLKMKLCAQVTELVKILNPAEVRVRGTLLFELHAAVAEMAKRRATSGEADSTELRAMLLHSKAILEEAVELLKHEPAELPEGKIHLQAMKNLTEMENLLRQVHISIGDSIL
ncbi:SET and MYND domain containing arthropod-specific member 1 [Carabus blaptoides fortunei]